MQEPTESPEVTFARRLRERREGQGLSQSALAIHLEVVCGIKLDSTAITRIEKGSRSIRLNEAVALADALGHTIDTLLRPALPLAEQINQAEHSAEQAHWRVAHALAEMEMEQRRVDVLREQANREEEG